MGFLDDIVDVVKKPLDEAKKSASNVYSEFTSSPIESTLKYTVGLGPQIIEKVSSQSNTANSILDIPQKALGLDNEKLASGNVEEWKKAGIMSGAAYVGGAGAASLGISSTAGTAGALYLTRGGNLNNVLGKAEQMAVGQLGGQLQNYGLDGDVFKGLFDGLNTTPSAQTSNPQTITGYNPMPDTYQAPNWTLIAGCVVLLILILKAR